MMRWYCVEFKWLLTHVINVQLCIICIETKCGFFTTIQSQRTHSRLLRLCVTVATAGSFSTAWLTAVRLHHKHSRGQGRVAPPAVYGLSVSSRFTSVVVTSPSSQSGYTELNDNNSRRACLQQRASYNGEAVWLKMTGAVSSCNNRRTHNQTKGQDEERWD